jgi:glycosyltransferase involved in cell wall biosynthesis
MTDERYRVLAIATHPVQYMAPVFRRMAVHPAVDLHVAYCSLRGAESGHDPEFGADIQWDVPLLDGYSWQQVPNRGSGKESFFGLRNPGLWKLIRGGNYDAVLCFVGYVRATFWIACLAAHSSATAFLFGCDQGSLEPRDGRAWKRMLKKRAWPILYRLADHVVVSSNNAKDLVHSLGIPEEHITLTPLAVDNEWWVARSAQVDRTSVRESWGASAKDLVILFCAKLQPWKRPRDLLRAFAQAKIAGGLLVFAGEGPLRGPLGEEAASLGVASRVRFLGFVNQSQLPAVYASSDLMVLPSEFEPFGAAVNEAMCCGCATAASDRCGATRDLVAPVAPELVFRCGDIDALAKTLRDASADRARLEAIGQAARRHMQTWSPQRNIAATVDAVRIATGRKRRASSRTASELAPSQPARSTTGGKPLTR